MRLSILAVGTLAMALALGLGPACSESENGGTGGAGGSTGGSGGTGGTGGTGGSTGGTGGSTGGTGGSTGGSGGSGADMGGAAVVYADVKPIFMAKCGSCHSAGNQGAAYHTLADSATDATKMSYSCSGKTKGACTLDRIKAGTMPSGKGCTGNPAMDIPAKMDVCLTQDEQDKLQAWITGGLK